MTPWFSLVGYQAVLVQNRGWLEVLRQLMLRSCMTLSTQKLGNFRSLIRISRLDANSQQELNGGALKLFKGPRRLL